MNYHGFIQECQHNSLFSLQRKWWHQKYTNPRINSDNQEQLIIQEYVYHGRYLLPPASDGCYCLRVISEVLSTSSTIKLPPMQGSVLVSNNNSQHLKGFLTHS